MTHHLDATDPLAGFTSRFIQSNEVRAYLDGNSLGRPLTATLERLAGFVSHDWGSRLIRSWDEQWMQLPLALGDRIGHVTLGAAAGQCVVADSTTVLLYKLIRAAVDARPGRTEIVIDRDNFPTDRFILEGIAAERGLTLRWIDTDPDGGVTPELVADAVGPDTALVVLSQVAYRSGFIAEVEQITAITHESGALMLWDLCHSAGVVPTELDAWNVDIAVGCSYKYLNGGPGAPAFAYVASRLQPELHQPIQGWMGAADVFAMADEFVPADGMRRFLSGTPPVLAMVPLHDMLNVIEEAGLPGIRSKSLALTAFVIEWSDANLSGLGVTVGSPRADEHRGSHVTLRHPAFREVTELLWRRDVIPDFRFPDGLRIGLSPLSTTFAEVQLGLELVRDILAELAE
ncbi:kynureninase [Salinibacterium xinjiangense]|uniref:Kynureninase n=1 Tax=Salinibacterium xinjiangense TaxID=386302 RepID=A0A2C8Z5M2_9MICO|nr:aminotransferase class V-fold PLP-dependent enzyme [Salinibacterium xinjiangense]GGK93122.1 kynureninase [Salinibacterium xinjiangense]SOE59000.1 Kynureninase [Salinibacterium xinjiangense]